MFEVRVRIQAHASIVFKFAQTDREAQPALVHTRLCSRHRKKAVFLYLVNRQVRFAQVVRAIASSKKSYQLGFQQAAE